MLVQIKQIVAEQLGLELLRATHMDFGHNSLVYDVALPTGNVIVRTNVDPRVFVGTAHNLTIRAGLGLPVPRILAQDFSKAHYPFAYMSLEKIPGRDLRYELPSMTQAQISRFALHARADRHGHCRRYRAGTPLLWGRTLPPLGITTLNQTLLKYNYEL